MSIDHNTRPFAKHRPAAFFVVAEQLLDFLHHGVMFICLA
uniref:Uncharacterized protein n=1 Tax=Rhizophora mucronata TaxID=61149 RepID=A0A2P2PMB6_RHIMU